MRKNKFHLPVLVREVVSALAPLKRARIIDATLGTGGHSLELVKNGAYVLGIEADREMLEIAEARLKKACPTHAPLFGESGAGSFKLTRANFRDIDSLALKEGFKNVDGIIFDLGVSNLQLTSPSRGFSFAKADAPLDMRVNKEGQGLTAKDLLNALREDQLKELFSRVLTRSEATFLAKLIVQKRKIKPFETVGDFLPIARRIKGKKGLDPATLPFLGLRMAVNSELENLYEALPRAFSLLKKGGKLLVITFHSLEEKVVLDFYFGVERGGRGKVLTRNSIKPSEEEVRENPRARSAELFILEKL